MVADKNASYRALNRAVRDLYRAAHKSNPAQEEQIAQQCAELQDAYDLIAILSATNAQLHNILERQAAQITEAVHIWQKYHNKPKTLPEFGELIRWLLSRISLPEALSERLIAQPKVSAARRIYRRLFGR